MKKAIIIFCLIGSGLIILSSLNIAHSLILFFFVGVIPGTNIVISPIDMMATSATAFTIIVLRLTIWPTVAKSFFLEPPVTRQKRTTKTRRASA